MTPLTQRQHDCLDAIRALTQDHVPPTVQEIAAHLGMTSRGHVHDILSRLRGRGAITWTPRLPRSIRVVEDQVSPAALHALSDETLRVTAAHIAGILAQRGGAHQTAEVFHRIADRLPGVRGKAA